MQRSLVSKLKITSFIATLKSVEVVVLWKMAQKQRTVI